MSRAGPGVTQIETSPVVGRIGVSVPRTDAPAKVKGEFAYSSDLQAAGMLWGHTLRSPHAHARIVSIDIGPALTMAGVHAVLTHADVPGRKTYGLEFPDQPVLAIDRVRYHGEPVAVVAAEHPEQARRAAAAISVVYEELEPVADMERATDDGAAAPRPADDGPRLSRRPEAERRPAHRHPPRRSGRAGRRDGRRGLRRRHPGSGVPRPRVGSRRPRR